MSDVVRIRTVESVNGSVILPGSKSMTHRALLMSALSDGPSTLIHALKAEDTLLTASNLSRLGVKIRCRTGSDDGCENEVNVEPPKVRWPVSEESLFVGNSGTTMRLLLGVVAAGSGKFILDGSSRMKERPIGPVASALERLGVECKFLEKEGFPPIAITSRGLKSGYVEVDATRSSQFLSSLLLASPCSEGPVVIRWQEPVASFPYVRMTLRMMEERGIRIVYRDESEIEVPAPQGYRPGRVLIEGDCSSASYFWAAAAITGGRVETYPVFHESYQGDAAFLNILEMMGCTIERTEAAVRVEGPAMLKSVDVDMNSMPDMVPTLAVIAAFAPGKTVIRNVAHLRIKESDRLAVVAAELAKLGTRVEIIDPDKLVIYGGRPLNGAVIQTHNDHRIAMAFSVMGLKIDGIVIKDPDVVAKSFPSYWDTFASFVYGLDVMP